MKAAAFVPVRLSSTRLPSKALLNLQGKPCIQHLIERIKQVEGLDLIVLCTTTNPSDNKLIDLSKKLKINYFRGDEKDVLERYNKAAQKFEVSHIINIDGDDIFCDPSYINKTLEELKSSDTDFVMWKDMPLGSTPIGMKSEALYKVCKLKNTSDTETGWARFFTETGLFKIKYLTVENLAVADSSIRLTLDYPEDFELFQRIHEELHEPFSIEDIVNLLRSNPNIRKINQGLTNIYKKNFEEKSAKIKMKDNYS